MKSVKYANALAESTSGLIWVFVLFFIDTPSDIQSSINICLIYSIIFSIPSMLLYQKSREHNSLIKSITPALLPLFSSVILFLFLDITISIYSIIGGLLITLTILTVKLKEYNKQK